ncbi:hypothetical protein JWG39_11450 [Desulforhopalus vacuolatus]|uniref:hypothetical protein n=1 Tax=Desulforhopalus vacuolatus TaxID=40414 RepID=UPI0019629797|nr:hypothetical protein [Desulforhopalus vacuolatus]MBM9520428.1 hypothetical protein [Desulforhopalus vacuolatus]
MKKIIASALGLAMVGGVATTAFAVENQFGGYWRTWAYSADQMNQDDDSQFIMSNRTRLYYTAKFSENFKFVNKFEFDSSWGDNDAGDIGADGHNFELKNSYADFTLGNVNTKIGIMGTTIGRGFIFDDDFSGVLVTPTFGDNALTLGYISISNSDLGDSADDPGSNNGIALAQLSLKPSDTLAVTPYVIYSQGTDVTLADEVIDGDNVTTPAVLGDVDLYYLGVDFDVQTDAMSLWSTFIYNGGEYNDIDVSAFLGAFGLEAGVAHGSFVYSTGDDDDSDGDMNAFVPTAGTSFYWSEILGYGVFDYASPLDSRSVGEGVSIGADEISDLIAVNAGVTFNPMPKMTLSGDVWYACLAEENSAGDSYIGTELDAKLTYSIFDNLTADLVVAYLFAGDVVEEDVTEAGVQLSLKF